MQFAKGLITTIALQILGIIVMLFPPITLMRVFQAFWPGGKAVANRDFLAFSWTDAFFRGWYDKIAKDFRDYGRFGYAWDDGFGLALGPRIYNNFATYWLLEKLGTRTMMAVGYILFVSVFGFLASFHFEGVEVLVLCTLLAVSPLVVCGFTHLGKPEMFWWSFALVTFYLAIIGEPIAAGVLWSFIAFCNVPVAVLTMLLLVPAVFCESLTDWFGFFFSMLPGILKICVRIVYMWQTGYMSKIANAQTGLCRRGWVDFGEELVLFAPIALALWIAIEETGALGLWVSFGCLTILYYLNWRLIYINDQQSFMMLALVFAMAVTIGSGVLVGASIALIVAARLVVFPAHGTRPISIEWNENGFSGVRKAIVQRLSGYPWLKIIKKPQIEEPIISEFFKDVRQNSRIISESYGKVRESTRERNFWEWARTLLMQKRISLANDIYSGINAPELGSRYLDCFNADSLQAEEMIHVAEILGAKYMITFTDKTRLALTHKGARTMAEIKWPTISEELSAGIAPAKSTQATLLQLPVSGKLIEPPTAHLWEGGGLTFPVSKDREYRVKFNYDLSLKAFVSSRRQPIKSYFPFEDLEVRFITIVPTSSGTIRIS